MNAIFSLRNAYVNRLLVALFLWGISHGPCFGSTLGNLTASYPSASTTPVTDSAPDITTGSTATLSLAFSPSVGAQLTVINNTGNAFISGNYDNLTHGQTLSLNYGGTTYQFVANYYGGNGNDLVLVWKNNRLMSWGANEFAQLGDGTWTDRTTPTAITFTGPFAGKTLISTATGLRHSLALFSDGTVAAWGINDSGQIGDGTTDERTVPVAVDTTTALDGKTVVAIAAGSYHSLALCSDGTVVSWGQNDQGQLGDGSSGSGSNPSPQEVDNGATTALFNKTVVAIAAAPNHNLALCSDGSLVAWGQGLYGQLGNGASVNSSVAVAVDVTGVLSGKTITAIDAGSASCMALCHDGSIATWGVGATLGNGTSGLSNVPVLVSTSGVLSGRTPIAIAAGESHNLALCSDGVLVSWGYNWSGQMGIGVGYGVYNTPVLVNAAGVLAGKTVTRIRSGSSFSQALCSDGTFTAWGRNDEGAIGDGTTTQANSPVEVDNSALTAGEKVSKLGTNSSGFHSMVIVASPPTVGNLSFDFNAATDIALTVSDAFFAPTDTANLSLEFAPTVGAELMVIQNTGNHFINGHFNNLAHGQSISLSYGGTAYQFVANYYGGSGNDLVLVWKNNQLYSWGLNDNGELGDGSSVYRTTPVGVVSSGVLANKTILSIAAGGNHTLALCSDGTIAAWGYNNQGQLGNGSTTGSFSPVAVTMSGVLAGKTVVAVSAGYNHSLALCSDGTMASWGANSWYQLGNGSSTDSNVPALVETTGVLAGKTVMKISAGGYHSLALCTDGSLIAWGAQWSGQLGDGGFGSGPVAVSTASGSSALHGKTIIEISAGGQHSMALCSDGTLTAWGSNLGGVIGDGTTDSRSEPVLVSAASGSSFLFGKTVIRIHAGWRHSMALCSDGSMATWGVGDYGQLGIGPSTSASYPTAVVSSGLPLSKTVATMSGGGNHSTAIANDGTWISWGLVLGNGTSSSSDTPVAVDTSGALSGKTVIATSSGAGHSLAICAVPAGPASPPDIQFATVAALTGTSAQLGGEVISDGGSAITERGVVYSISSVNDDPEIGGPGVTTVTTTGTTGEFSLLVSGLSPGEEYAFKAYATNSAGTAYTWSPLFTSPTVPSVIDPTSAGITSTSATLGGNVTSSGGASIGKRGVVYSLTSVNNNPEIGGTGTTHVFEYASSGVFTLPVTNLIPGGQYSFKAYAENVVGNGYSTVGTFSALAVVPDVSFAFLLDNLGISATLGGYVDNDGGSAIIERGFVYSATSTNTDPLIGGAGVIKVTTAGTIGDFSATITGLTSGVSYHYKAYATNAVGTDYSHVQNFSAATAPVVTNPRVIQHPPIATVDLGGYVFSNGGASIIEQGVVYSLTATDADPHIGEAGVTKVEYVGSIGDFFIPITGLTPVSGYSFKAYAINVMGTSYSNVSTFTTPVAPSGNLTFTYNAATDVAVTTSSMVIGASSTATLTLGYAPTIGTELTVIRNTEPAFVIGNYSNLVQGQTVTLTYGGQNYDFVVNYYGGSGNDLVLVWKYTRLFSWGVNDNEQLGDGSRAISHVPVAAKSGELATKTIIKVATGARHCLALSSDGTVAQWGLGQSSNESLNFQNNVVAIAAGNGFSLLLRSNGTVRSWGYPFESGQLGRAESSSPGLYWWVNIGEVSQTGGLAGKSVTAIAAGYSHALALCSDGTIAAWGSNNFGQVGDGTTTNRNTPVAVDLSGALLGKTVVAIAAGANHSLALCSDGTLVEWGSTAESNVPVVVSPSVVAGKTVTSIAAGGNHCLALCSDGTVAAWRSNQYGQLGNGNRTNSGIPVAVVTAGALSGKIVTGIEAGRTHSLAYCSDGTVVTWGGDGCGELGVTSALEGNAPVAVDMYGAWSGGAVVSASASDQFTVVIGATSNQSAVAPVLGAAVHSHLTSRSAIIRGEVAHDGRADIIERGIVYSQSSIDADPTIGGPGVIKSVNTGTTGAFQVHVSNLSSVTPYSYKTYATNIMGTTYSSVGTFSPLSLTTLSDLTADFTTPSLVPVTETGVSISEGSNVTLSLNHEPAVGDTLTIINNTGLEPISGRFSNLSQYQIVSLSYAGCAYEYVANYFGGDGNDLVLQWRNIKAVAWGADYFGHLGNGMGDESHVPVDTEGNINFFATAANNFQSLALREDGRVLHWGLDWVNSDANTSPNLRSGGVFTSGLTPKAVSIAAGGSHSLALLTDGQIVAWGENVFGQFGDGNLWEDDEESGPPNPGPLFIDKTMFDESYRPIPGKTVVSIAAGSYHSMALCSDGTVAAWGRNNQGQLGYGCKTERRRPVMVNTQGALAGKVVVAIAAGWEHSLVLCSDGTLVSWGSNGNGQLGIGTISFSKTLPVAVDMSGAFAGKTVVSISSQGGHNLALCSDGTLVAWGSNAFGQLGNGTTTNSAVPVIVNSGALIGKTVVSISAGDRHSMALCTDGTLVAWGVNDFGQLGNGTEIDSSVPVLVNNTGVLSGRKMISLAAGAEHSLALTAVGYTPTVNSPTSADVTFSTATLGGNVEYEGTSPITERGIVLSRSSVNGNPAIGGSGVIKVTSTGSTGSFALPVSGLQSSSDYSFRAYAINASGISYSSVAIFHTLNAPPEIKGAFSAQQGVLVNINASSLASDADGDNLSIIAVNATSENGAVIANFSTYISYQSSASFTGLDSFSITISDGQGNNTTGTVVVQVAAPGASLPLNQGMISVGSNGDVKVLYRVAPAMNYEIQRSTDLQNWQTQAQCTPIDFGLLPFIDLNPPAGGKAFYRVIPSP